MLDRILGREKDISELEDERERAAVKRDIQTLKTEEAERKAIQKDLKNKFGGGWRKLLGLKLKGGRVPIQDLRSVQNQTPVAAGRKTLKNQVVYTPKIKSKGF